MKDKKNKQYYQNRMKGIGFFNNKLIFLNFAGLFKQPFLDENLCIPSRRLT
jgi:hypothetical protein